MTKRVENENNRRVRQGRKLVWQRRYCIWIDNENLICVGDFWMDDFGDKNSHQYVKDAELEYGHVYAVRLADRGQPS